MGTVALGACRLLCQTKDIHSEQACARCGSHGKRRVTNNNHEWPEPVCSFGARTWWRKAAMAWGGCGARPLWRGAVVAQGRYGTGVVAQGRYGTGVVAQGRYNAASKTGSATGGRRISSVKSIDCPCGGIGRRDGLKIRCPLGRACSSQARGTIIVSMFVRCLRGSLPRVHGSPLLRRQV